MRIHVKKVLCFMFVAVLWSMGPALGDEKKPNILVIWGDDIGTWNISYNNHGMMGYKTPNIDRLAKEGAVFTDYYGQQSARRVALPSSAAPCPCARA